MTNLLEFMDRTPPFWAYALARHRGGTKPKRITLREISNLSGLSFRTVTRISAKLSWKGVKIEQADAFLRACDFDAFHPQRQKEFVRKAVESGDGFTHLTKTQIKTLNRNVKRLEMIRVGSEPPMATSEAPLPQS